MRQIAATFSFLHFANFYFTYTYYLANESSDLRKDRRRVVHAPFKLFTTSILLTQLCKNDEPISVSVRIWSYLDKGISSLNLYAKYVHFMGN